MPDHYVSISQGESGFVQTDFTGHRLDCRRTDRTADQRRTRAVEKNVILALKAFERFIENRIWVTAAGLDVRL
jgi:hypothetical protein